MSAPPYMKLFWGDYHKRTRHLKRDQHGAYFLLIGEAWQLGGALPDDDAKLAAWALCTPEEWAVIKPVVMEFFALRRGKWWHDRVREELASYEAISRKRKEAGKKGGKASGGNTTGNQEANAFPLPTKPEPEPEPKKEIELVAEATLTPNPKGRVYPEAFEAAWRTYPHHKGRSSKPNAAAVWAKLPADEREGLVAAIRRFAPNVGETCGGKGAPDMAVWLKDGKHLNWGVGQDDPLPPAPSTFNAPQVRASIVHATDEDFARRWVDHYCRWDGGARRLEARTPAVAAALAKFLAGWAERNSVTITVAAANDGAQDKQERAA
jgi:uncharacterized protein YdaU (DUF1376 family)